MPKRERSLILDIGSTAIHVGEFEYHPTGEMTLHGFACVEYEEQLTEGNRPLVIGTALRTALEGGRISSIKRAAICVSGQATYMRFVKLPPVTEEEARVRQIVEYEARQNVPFPMDEVIWDYQLIGGSDEEDLEVMFAVIKNDIVDGTLEAVINAGLRPTLVDFAPAALYNAARANYIGEDGCAMLLDIGGRCTNLLFLDGPRFFARAIPIAGFSITQQIAKEFNIPTDEAEELKRRHGFVALGGAYEEPESEVAATTSKIVRNVMTRLHGEINRSINVYRTQQKGSKPTHLYLSGGSSIMEFTTHFFSEKLRMEVSYFNPLQIVGLGPEINAQELEEVAHLMPEVVGSALRHAHVECPVQISLITERLAKQQSFSKRVPWLAAAGVVWLLILAVLMMVNMWKIRHYSQTKEDKAGLVKRLEERQSQIDMAERAMKGFIGDFDTVGTVLETRYHWHDFFNAIQACMPRDVWLTQITPAKPQAERSSREDRRRAAEERMAGEGAPPIDPFGGGGELDFGDPGTSGSSETPDKYELFHLTGYAVQLPERLAADQDPRLPYVRPIFTPEQIARFEKIRNRRLEELGEGNEPDESERPLYEPFWGEVKRDAEGNPVLDESGRQVIEPYTVNRTTELEILLLQSLQFSDYFSHNPDGQRVNETRPVSITVEYNKVRNLTRFILEVKLNKPLSTKRD